MNDALIHTLAGALGALPQVEAVALAGSRGRHGGGADAHSDVDLVVCTRAAIEPAALERVIETAGGARRADLGLPYWGGINEFIAAADSSHIDIVLFDAAWLEARVLDAVEHHRASLGYSTCFWHTVRQAVVLFDRGGWFEALQGRADTPYPEPLARAIVALNHPVLRRIIPSYANQIARAVARRDAVSANHRVAALLASYFDIVFAVNRLPHPGEKRLVELVEQRCSAVPQAMRADLDALFAAAGANLEALPGVVDRLLDRLDALLATSGFPAQISV